MSKILFLVPRMNIGGSESYVFSMAQEMHKRGHEVFVASWGGMLADALAKQGIKHFSIPVRFSKLLAGYMLLRILKKYNIDILHANSGAAGEVAAWIKTKLDIKVVYTAHGVFGNMEREYIIDRCDKIICVSNYVKQHAIEKGFTKDKLITLYTGIDSDKFIPNLEARKQLRQQYGIDDDTLVLGIVSRIKNFKQKGHGDLLDLFSGFPAAKKWKLIVIGKGNGLLPFQHQIKKRGLSDNIICLGHRDDVYHQLNAIDLLVLPTLFETFGLAIAEAMALGKPAVVYSVGGTPEVVTHGETGLLVEHRNVQALHDAIVQLDENRKLLQTMGDNAYQWVRNSLALGKSVDELEAVYQQLLAE